MDTLLPLVCAPLVSAGPDSAVTLKIVQPDRMIAMRHVRKILMLISLGSTTRVDPQFQELDETGVDTWKHPSKSDCNVTLVCATFPSYLGSLHQRALPALSRF